MKSISKLSWSNNLFFFTISYEIIWVLIFQGHNKSVTSLAVDKRKKPAEMYTGSHDGSISTPLSGSLLYLFFRMMTVFFFQRTGMPIMVIMIVLHLERVKSMLVKYKVWDYLVVENRIHYSWSAVRWMTWLNTLNWRTTHLCEFHVKKNFWKF